MYFVEGRGGSENLFTLKRIDTNFQGFKKLRQK